MGGRAVGGRRQVRALLVLTGKAEPGERGSDRPEAAPASAERTPIHLPTPQPRGGAGAVPAQCNPGSGLTTLPTSEDVASASSAFPAGQGGTVVGLSLPPCKTGRRAPDRSGREALRRPFVPPPPLRLARPAWPSHIPDPRRAPLAYLPSEAAPEAKRCCCTRRRTAHKDRAAMFPT